jgi:phosphoribosylformylglycinamidine synthase subunit PurS
MGMKAHVWVMPKRTVLDPQGKTIHHALSSLGYEQVSDVRQGKFFVLNLDGWNRDEAQKQVERISKEVLANPVIEEFRFEIVEEEQSRWRCAFHFFEGRFRRAAESRGDCWLSWRWLAWRVAKVRGARKIPN